MPMRQKCVCPILSVLLTILVLSSVSASETTKYRDIECIAFGNGHSTLYIDSADFSLVGLCDSETSVDMVLEPGSPLFCVSFLKPTPKWYATQKVYSSSGCGARKHQFKRYRRDSTDYLELHYDGCRITEVQSADFVVTISIRDDQKVFRWNLRVNNATDAPLYEVKFPTLMGLGAEKDSVVADDYLVLPIRSGKKEPGVRKLSATQYGQGLLEYPSMGVSVQVMCYVDPPTGSAAYMGAEDAEGFRKTFCVKTMPSKKSFGWYILHYADGREKNGDWTLPYSIAAGVLHGDWYDVAKDYRRWIQRCGKFTLNSERDIPEWMQNIGIWFQGQDRWSSERPNDFISEAFLTKLKDIRERIGEPYGFHWYLWYANEHRFDYSYPDYLPARGNFKDAVADLKKLGIHSMPYINVEIFDSHSDMWQTDKAEQWASRKVNGDFYKLGWREGRKNVNMCVRTDYWQDKIVNILTRLVTDYGVDALYMDELHVFPYACHAKNHKHAAPHGGNEFIGSYRTIIERVRKECGVPNVVITGEGCSEAYADVVTAQLNGHSDIAYDSLPFFQSVMRDYTIEFGLVLMRPEMKNMHSFAAKVGFCFVRGRQLGWFNFDQAALLGERFDKQVEFLKRVSAARRGLKEYLLYGEMLRGPELTDIQEHTVAWARGFGKRAWPITIPDVLSSAYRAPDGKVAIVLVNTTEAPQECAVVMNEKEFTIGNEYTVELYRDGSWTDKKRRALPKAINISVPAFSPLAIVVH